MTQIEKINHVRDELRKCFDMIQQLPEVEHSEVMVKLTDAVSDLASIVAGLINKE